MQYTPPYGEHGQPGKPGILSNRATLRDFGDWGASYWHPDCIEQYFEIKGNVWSAAFAKQLAKRQKQKAKQKAAKEAAKEAATRTIVPTSSTNRDYEEMIRSRSRDRFFYNPTSLKGGRLSSAVQRDRRLD